MHNIKYIICLLCICTSIFAQNDDQSNIDIKMSSSIEAIEEKLKDAIREFENALKKHNSIPRDSIDMLYNKARTYSKYNNDYNLYFSLWNEYVNATCIRTANIQEMLIESAQCIAEAEQLKKPLGHIYALHCQAYAYAYSNNPKIAVNVINQCIKIMQGLTEEDRKYIDVNINMTHLNIDKVRYMLYMGVTDGVEELIRAAENENTTNQSKNEIKVAKAIYIAATEHDTTTAIQLIESAYNAPENELPMYPKVEFYINAYKASGNYQRCLDYINNFEGLKDEGIYTRKYILQEQAQILEHLGNNKKALLSTLIELNHTNDRIKKLESQNASKTFAEKMRQKDVIWKHNLLQNQLYEQKTQTSKRLLVLLIITAVILLLFVTYITRRNRKLKNYKSVLNSQNAELRDTELQLTNDIRNINALNNLKSSFLKNMTQNVRKPLNKILESCELLSAKTSNNPGLNQFMKLINTQNVLLEKIINDVITISELDSSEKIEKKLLPSLNALCQSIIDDVKSSIPNDVVLFFNQWQNEQPLMTSELYLRMIIKNLIQNSLKFTPHGTITISIATNEKNKTVDVTIRDTGIGIPENKQHEIFERFSKISEFSQGVGLGLPICAKAAELIDAKLTLVSSTSAENATVDTPSGSVFMLSISL